MGTNLSHLGKAGKSSTQKCLFGGDMLVSRRAILNNHVSKILVRSRDLFSKHCVDSQLFRYNSCYKQTLTWSEKRNCKQSTSKNITKTQVDGWMNSLFWKPLFIRCCGSTRPKKRTKPEKWRESKILTSWSWKKRESDALLVIGNHPTLIAGGYCRSIGRTWKSTSCPFVELDINNHLKPPFN